MTANITVTLTDTSGDPLVGARVNAKLFVPDRMDDFTVPEDSNVTGTTDAAGQCVLALWPNSANTDISTYYRFRAWHPVTKAKVLDVCGYVDVDAALEAISYDCKNASGSESETVQSAALAAHIQSSDPHPNSGFVREEDIDEYIDSRIVGTSITIDAAHGDHISPGHFVYTLDAESGEHMHDVINVTFSSPLYGNVGVSVAVPSGVVRNYTFVISGGRIGKFSVHNDNMPVSPLVDVSYLSVFRVTHGTEATDSIAAREIRASYIRADIGFFVQRYNISLLLDMLPANYPFMIVGLDDAPDGAALAYSDGSNWRLVHDNTIIS